MNDMKPLPCPFCGSDRISVSGFGEGVPLAFVECDSCEGFIRASTMSEVISKWNRRAVTHSDMRALRDAIDINLLDSREKSLALTKLEECEMWIRRAKEAGNGREDL